MQPLKGIAGIAILGLGSKNYLSNPWIHMAKNTARITVLDNGVTVVTRHAQDAATTDIAIKILAGSRDEVTSSPRGSAHALMHAIPYPRGTAHFAEHRVVAGSVDYPKVDARTLIEGMPGFDPSCKHNHYFTPATQFSFTNHYAAVPVASTNAVLDIMTAMIARPLFTQRGMEHERKYIANERIDTQLSYDPSNLENWFTPQVAHGGNPAFHPVIGSKRGIQEISIHDLKAFYAENVTGNRVVIAIEGHIPSHDAIVKTVNKNTSSLPPGIRPASDTPVYTGGDGRYWLYGDGGTRVALAFKTPPESDSKAVMTFKVLHDLLTMKAGKHSLSAALKGTGIYRQSILLSKMVDAGLLTVTLSTMDTRTALEAIQKTLFDLATKVDPQALSQIRAQQRAHVKSTETLFKVGAIDMAWDIFLHGKVMPPDHYSRLKLQVSKSDIQEAVREMLSHPPTFVAAGDLKPLPSSEEIRDMFLLGKEINTPHLRANIQPPASASRYTPSSPQQHAQA